jgi:hypothetical protein
VATARSFAALALGLCLAAALFTGAGALRSPVPAPAAAPIAAPGPRLSYPEDRLPRLSLPGGRSETIRSVLNIDSPMRYGDFVWNEDGVPTGPVWVRVDLKRQLLSVFRAGHEIGAAVILYGAGDKPSPTGAFPVLQKAADYRSRTYDADMPFMLRLTADGVAIHGAAVRRGAATHGCIGVPTAFARRLFGQVRLGDPVVILDAAAKS